MNVLANDGISKSGKDSLEKDGFNVSTVTVAQNQLISYVNKENISVLLVRSATTVRKDLIDQCPGLKIIGRGGVGMDNIDVDYARNKGINVINTPAASSASVAELVFAHLYSGVRFLFKSNRAMPLEGDSNFKGLKKTYAKGVELRGKTIGIIGFGRIGKETAKIAIGVGMKVLAYDKFLEKADLTLDFHDGKKINFEIKISKFDYLLKNSDFISLHVPAQKNFVINKNEIDMMKDGAGLINAARGGVVNEVELVSALDSGKLSFAGLDTFENEPKPAVKLLMHPKISLTPHIGAATNEAQDRIGLELADQIKSILS
ncbi:MAG TPA: 3-phosphoglycerate dehydrogenase [Flavobacteriaceae bacterium]|nr:3-phosphoglycerate dehydrogenase [Flavobacteriaceae bacterium]